jgi:hypothetical protein
MEPLNAKSPVVRRTGRGWVVWAVVAFGATAPGAAQAQLPAWVIDSSAGPALKQLWQESDAARAERVACGSAPCIPTSARPMSRSGLRTSAPAIGP